MRRNSTIHLALVCALILPGVADAASKAAKTYKKYRKVVENDGDHGELPGFFPKDKAEWLGALSAEELEGWFEMVMSDRRGFDRIEVRGDDKTDEGRTLEVEGRRKADGKKGVATVRMIEEGGAWKVDREDWDFAWDVRFEPTEDRSMMKGDHARGTLRVGDQSVALSHAYVGLQQDPFNPEKPALSLLLSDVELHPSQFYQLRQMVERGEAHYIELTILRDQTVTSAMVNHDALENDYVSMAGGIRCEAKQFGPSVIAGRVFVAGDRPELGSGVGFDIEFRSTLWWITEKSLVNGGSGELDPGAARGAFRLDDSPTELGHAYARRHAADEGEEVEILLTAKPVGAELLGQVESLTYLLDHVAPALSFRIDAEGEASYWRWTVGDFSSGCGFCSDLVVNVEGRGADAVHATAYTPRPKRHDGRDYQFKVSFHADLRPPTEAAATTGAATPTAQARPSMTAEEMRALMLETMEKMQKMQKK